MKAFLILEDGHVFTGTSIGSAREVISEIVFNTSMTGYLEVPGIPCLGAGNRPGRQPHGAGTPGAARDGAD